MDYFIKSGGKINRIKKIKNIFYTPKLTLMNRMDE